MEPHGRAARGAGAAVGPAGLRRTQAVHSDVLDEDALLSPRGREALDGSSASGAPLFRALEVSGPRCRARRFSRVSGVSSRVWCGICCVYRYGRQPVGESGGYAGPSAQRSLSHSFALYVSRSHLSHFQPNVPKSRPSSGRSRSRGEGEKHAIGVNTRTLRLHL